MKTSIPTAALVALYLSLVSSVSAAEGGSIEALLSRVAEQHKKALPSHSLVAVTTVASGSEPLPTILQPGAVVLNPKGHETAGAKSHARMAKKVRAKRALEEAAPAQALFALGEEAQRKEREKRWIWAHSIIQDGDTGAGIPTDGSNANLLSATAVAMTTPKDTATAVSFAPASSAAPAPVVLSSVAPVIVASSVPAAPVVSVAPVVNAVGSSSAAPVASSSAPAVANLANILIHPVSASITLSSVSVSIPVSATSAPSAATTKVFTDVHHHHHGGHLAALKASKKAQSNGKRWVWGSSIIQDGDAPVSQHETPQATVVAPTFPPLAEATASVIAAFSAPEPSSSVAAFEGLALESAIVQADVAVPTTTIATEVPAAAATTATTTGNWIEERLAAIAAGLEEAEQQVESAFSRERRGYKEHLMAEESEKRVRKLVRKAIN